MKSRRAVRRPHLLIAACLLALIGATVPARPEDADGTGTGARPNVLFIVIDDLAPRLGCYGDEVAFTPSIDALAARGVVFEQAHCQYPLCVPSRASFLTGRYPSTIGVMTHFDFLRQRAPDVVTLPQLFRRAGWFTARAGKIFHHDDDDPISWDVGGTPPRLDNRTTARFRDYQSGSDRWGPIEEASDRGGRGADRDDVTTRRAVELLEEHGRGDRPFFLGIGYRRPHAPFLAPKRFFERFEDGELPPLPPDFAPKPTPPAGAVPWALPPNVDVFVRREATEEDARSALAAYHACVSYIDEQVGTLLATVDRLGLRDDTIVVVFGDQGYHLGERGKWAKHGSLYEPATRVPLVIAAPGRAPARCARVVELVDLLPTLAELVGIEAPPEVDGDSLVPLLDDPTRAWDRPAVTFFQDRSGVGITLRDERRRLIAWEGRRRGEELYDHATDPRESRNAAGDPAQATALAALRRRLASVPRPAPDVPPPPIGTWALAGLAVLLGAGLLARVVGRRRRSDIEDDGDG